MSFLIDIEQEPEYSLTITGDCPDYAIQFELDAQEYEVAFSEIGLPGSDGADGRNVPIGEYVYHAASATADTEGDWRQYADADGFYFQICTVASATKGGGTWVTKFTIQA